MQLWLLLISQFYAELNDFLPRHKKQTKISHSFTERASIKDMIESLGVPHTEVDCIEVNGEYVDFCYIVQDGDNYQCLSNFC